MPVKKRGMKKSVSFSDDETLTRVRQSNDKKHNASPDGPPVYVKKTVHTVPLHLVGLLYYFIKLSDSYDCVTLLYLLVPLQIAYLALQFNRNTVYGHKVLKLRLSLVPISLGAALILTIPCMLIIILLGAPIAMLLQKTWLLAAHCCFLGLPAVYSVFNCNFKVGIFKKYFVAIAVGCWISCVVIPLDWDRDWQEWPTPLVVGAYLGAFVGYTVGPYI
ncbi:LANO_0H10902g1_1 [Lachancea nothofagi CBS 11611]|uniref:Glycosylphosphatidylinositol anchor biosynthesis protein 11 n=1 Tax=Lachancea nothofagi CBS 11611 TaxID=1266666 RepID=A0A1G4KLZ9_9SACH|nr:LANO_0H10902g1_1 [Lachancea nothofagi CBS 11611]